MTSPSDIAGMIELATRELGSVDILENNAGIQHPASVQEFPLDRWNAVIAINLTAAFLAIRASLSQMLRRDWGRIVHIAPTHGPDAPLHKPAYVPDHHGSVGYTE